MVDNGSSCPHSIFLNKKKNPITIAGRSFLPPLCFKLFPSHLDEWENSKENLKSTYLYYTCPTAQKFWVCHKVGKRIFKILFSITAISVITPCPSMLFLYQLHTQKFSYHISVTSGTLTFFYSQENYNRNNSINAFKYM